MLVGYANKTDIRIWSKIMDETALISVLYELLLIKLFKF